VGVPAKQFACHVSLLALLYVPHQHQLPSSLFYSAFQCFAHLVIVCCQLLCVFSVQLISGCRTWTLRVMVGPLDQLKTVVPADQAGFAPTGPVTFKWV
jgi:hypothetical protein